MDCGATREAIDDNLYPACDKIEGPHRLALLLIRQEVRRVSNQKFCLCKLLERLLESGKMRLAQAQEQLAPLTNEEKALQASYDALAGLDDFEQRWRAAQNAAGNSR